MFIGFSVFLPADEEDRDDGRQQPEGTDDEREEDPGLGVRPAGRDRDRVDGDAQDHRADVLGGGRFEEVGTAAGAVADVVADEVRDDARVAGIVLGDALLDLTDEVRADVGGLRVDAAAELGEQGDERGPEAEADDEERRLGDGHIRHDGLVQGEDALHAEERQRDDEEAGDGATAHRDLDRLDEAAPGGRGGPDVRLHADVHADDPGRHRAQRTDEERERGHEPDRQAGQLRTSATSAVSKSVMTPPITNGTDDGEHEDRRVLAADEGDRAFEDRAGHGLHLGGAGIAGQHVAGEVDREQDGDDPRRRDDRQQRTRIHQGRRVLHGRSGPASVPWRVSVRRRGRVSGMLPAGPDGMHRGLGPCRPAASVTRRSSAGQTQPAARGYASGSGAFRDPFAAAAGGGPYTAGPVTKRPALGCLFEIVETLVLTLIIFVVIQNFVAQPYKVQQQSMERTLEPEQYVLVDKLTPRFDTYKRGDIVVFTPPEDWGDNGTPFIKRVIGEAGDTVEIRDDGLVYIDDVALDEPYLYADEAGGPPQPTTAPLEQANWTIAENEVFLMGDHRSNSADSRTFGPVEIDQVIGRAWLRYWPLDTFGILPAPTYAGLAAADS